jgi:hypothetical protein
MMTAIIDGSSWTAVSVTASHLNGLVTIDGSDTSSPVRSIELSMIGSSTGTYAMSTGSANALLTIGPQAWSANVVGGSGTITLSALSTTGATGTFSFTAIPSDAGSSGTRAVTSGVFNVTF